ncbi:MAG: divalent metal cation transporter [Schleiferiaceae bacterium]
MNTSSRLKALGPGILFASTAIGVSHLVQSTQAGAQYGWGLLWAVLLANLLKYPFFEYGTRYTSSTGKSTIEGYGTLGKTPLRIYLVVAVISMGFVTAAVGFVTAGFMQNLLDIDWPILAPILLFVFCGALLVSGRYQTLDRLIKILGMVLVITTLITFIAVLIKGPQGPIESSKAFEFPTSGMGVFFLLALMGWMPTAVDISAWSSLWLLEKQKTSGVKISKKDALFDFNLGYIITSLLAICFLILGAYVIYGTDNTLPNGAAAFANGVIGLYTNSLGDWSYAMIAACAFSIMFSTCITVIDGYARAVKTSIEVLKSTNSDSPKKLKGLSYTFYIVLTSLAGLALIFIFTNSPWGMKGLVNVATTTSFLVAPIIAIYNHRLVSKKRIGNDAPPAWIRMISYAGHVFLWGFTAYFLWIQVEGWVN